MTQTLIKIFAAYGLGIMWGFVGYVFSEMYPSHAPIIIFMAGYTSCLIWYWKDIIESMTQRRVKKLLEEIEQLQKEVKKQNRN